MDKYYEYVEREESYELRTGKVRSCLSVEKYFEIAREEGWLVDISYDEPEQNSTDEAMESAGDVLDRQGLLGYIYTFEYLTLQISSLNNRVC